MRTASVIVVASKLVTPDAPTRVLALGEVPVEAFDPMRTV
jgi:hypothetical protein